MRMKKSAFGIAVAALSISFGATSYARDMPSDHYHARHLTFSRASGVRRYYAEPAASYAQPWWFGRTGATDVGYWGGSSGGIPGTGAAAHGDYGEQHNPGILPEDRPYPFWSLSSNPYR